MRALTLLEGRVLGVLVEKALTVPDTYPLSLNALLAGCNQKTARDPVLAASEAEVQEALDALKLLHLVHPVSGARVTRWEHNAGRALGLPSQSVALLATLLLRGPQTAAELRANAERLHRFADLSSVEAFLDELAERAPDKGGPLVLRLPRAPGAREARWAQLLGGPVEVPAWAASDAPAGLERAPAAGLAVLQAELAALRDEVAGLRDDLAALRRSLGADGP
ncbi:YceH family protein [Piscinibacter sakaiensis]|uniref:Virulence factor mviM n=1 Tax=Piscinibacter sakaiensis TaxID=1547922 RepID=A0A0K8P3A5_PISS1|nr:YceH family protein [Piscinibacter sakaiensis]GAP37019.1 virulence factor mviM [Piscinibacter sakaiensis]